MEPPTSPMVGSWLAEGGAGDFYVAIRHDGTGEGAILVPTYRGQVDFDVAVTYLDVTPRARIDFRCRSSTMEGIACGKSLDGSLHLLVYQHECAVEDGGDALVCRFLACNPEYCPTPLVFRRND